MRRPQKPGCWFEVYLISIFAMGIINIAAQNDASNEMSFFSKGKLASTSGKKETAFESIAVLYFE